MPEATQFKIHKHLNPELGIGLGLRPPHYSQILAERPKIAWFEAITENYIGIDESPSGGKPLRVLEDIRRDYPVVLHGVSLSIGSVDPLDTAYLTRIKSLFQRIEPAWVSDHLCWTRNGSENLHDLLPLPFTQEALDHLVPRVQRVQEFLGRKILLENLSSYVQFKHSEMTEWEFMAELTRRADCGILLDINNVYVSASNHGFDPLAYLDGIPEASVGQMHLAGHSRQGELLVDTHDHPVSEPVWELYSKALARFGSVSTLVEWDAQIPSLERLMEEAAQAQALLDSSQQKGELPRGELPRAISLPA